MTLRVFFDRVSEKLNPFYWIFPHHFKRVTLHKALDLGEETEELAKKVAKLVRRGKDPTQLIRKFEKDLQEEIHHLFEIVRITGVEFDNAIKTMKEIEEGIHGKYYIADRDIIIQMRRTLDMSRGRFNELINMASRMEVYPYKPAPGIKAGSVSKLDIKREKKRLEKQQEELRRKHEQLKAMEKAA